VFLAVAFALGGCPGAATSTGATGALDHLPTAVVELVGPEGSARIEVWVAETPEARRRGLMGIEFLPDDTGMLFVFPEDRRGGFWMKDTLIPLDIAFMDRDGVLLAILRMEPCRADPCPVYDPGIAYRYALEVPNGWFEEHGVEPGYRAVVTRT
jgi:uncharacterized protein